MIALLLYTIMVPNMSLTHRDLTFLGEDVKAYPHSGSDSIYYDEYPYRISFTEKISGDTSIPLSVRKSEGKKQLQLMINEFLYNSQFKDKVRYNGLNVYFVNYEMMKEVLFFYGARVSDVAGPLDDEHAELLTNPEVKLRVAKTNFFGTYDCKLEFLANLRSWYSYRGKSEISVSDSVQFMRDNLEQSRIKNHWRFSADIYANYDEASTLLAFVRLQFPELRIRITRCLIR